VPNARATPAAEAIMTSVTRMNITGRETHTGSDGQPNAPCVAPLRCPTGKTITNAMDRSRKNGNDEKRSRLEFARRNPSPIPRKLARRTKFVK
jgi:hypothetical protein